MREGMPTPVIASFTGSSSDKKGQFENSLQALRGSVVTLTWKTIDAESVLLTDSSSSKELKLAASGTQEVKLRNDETTFTLVAHGESGQSPGESFHVSVHDEDELVSTHAEVEGSDEEEEGGDGGITALTVSAGGNQSKSFALTDEEPFASMKARGGHFCFAPTVDQLTVGWKTDGATPAVLLELFRAGSDQPIWRLPLGPKKVLKGELLWNGDFSKGELLERAAFPDGNLTAEHAPYLLRATAAKSAVEANQVRWTYLDVQVGALQISWAPEAAKMIPLAKDERARHVAVYSSLTRRDDAKNLAGKLPKVGQNKKVYLGANHFFQGDGDLTGEQNRFFKLIQQSWGNGPQIPLLVTARVIDAAGAAVSVPKALGKARFLWDYEDKSTPPDGALPDIKAFIGRVTKVNRDATEFSPAGANAHAKFGGKRGVDGLPIFPPQAGTAPIDTLPDAGDDAPAFPFKVTQCAKRKWAAVSEAWTTGALAGKSGVIFQPSRLAGDAYAIHVIYVSGSEDDAAAAAGARDTVPDGQLASTGTFTTWHRTNVAKYVQLGRGASDIDVQWVIDRQALHYCLLDYDGSKKVDGTDAFENGMRAIYSIGGDLRAKLAEYIQAAIPTTVDDSQPSSLVQFKPYKQWRAAMMALNGNDEFATYRKCLATKNPTNAIGDEKYDWVSRSKAIPLCMPHAVDYSTVINTDTQGKVLVEVTNLKGKVASHNVVFEADKRVVRGKNLEVPIADQVALAQLYCIAVRPDGYVVPDDPDDRKKIKVVIKGKTGKDGNDTRIANIKKVFDDVYYAWNRSDSEKGSNFPSNLDGELGGACDSANTYRNQCGYEWLWNVFELVLEKEFPAAEGGLYILQAAPGSKLANYHTPNAKAMYARDPGNKLVIVMSPTALAPTLGHEVGHAKFVNHTYVSAEPNDPLKLHQANAAAGCTLKQVGAKVDSTYCGICMLRMRGWSIFEVTDPAAGTFNKTQLLKHDM